MAIKVVNDVVAPIAVSAVDQVTAKWLPQGNEWFNYGMTALGYLGAGFNKGGDFVKNVAIASLPLTVRSIMTRFNITSSRQMAAPGVAHFRASAPMGGRMSSSRKEFANSQIG